METRKSLCLVNRMVTRFEQQCSFKMEVQLQASTGSPAASAVAEDSASTAKARERTGAGRQAPHLLYLAFEGVLHAEHHAWGRGRHHHVESRSEGKLFEHVHLLSSVLRPYPRVRIVLSTNWVSEFGFGVALAQLPRQLQDRVIGCTDQSVSGFAGQQVAVDVLARKPEAWLAFEVDLFGWPEWCFPHLVVCDPDLGIARTDVQADLEARLAKWSIGSA
jgi:hypothetical protein